MKLLTRTPEMMDIIRAALLEQVEKSVLTGGLEKINISYDVNVLCPAIKGAVKPVILYSPIAWIKIQEFTDKYNHEVALHGLVKKLKGPGQYYIYDVMAYPQRTTAATVKATDDYDMWLHKHSDSVFNDIRMQYHSHVNMPTGASGVDTSYYESMISDIQDYYIFIIGNKSSSMNHMVYDKEQNILFEKADIVYDVVDPATKKSLETWLQESDEFVETPVSAVSSLWTPPASPAAESYYSKPNTEYEYGYTDENCKFHVYPAHQKKAPIVKQTAAQKKAAKKEITAQQAISAAYARPRDQWGGYGYD